MESKNNDKRLEKGDETSAIILMSAMEIISHYGLSGISATKLSALSNVSKSTIFYHFNNIQEIPKAVLQLIYSSLLKPIEERDDDDDMASFLDRIGSSFIIQMNENIKLYKSFFSFYHESIFHADYRELMDDFLKTSKRNLAAVIKKLSQTDITDSEAAQTAALIVAALDGIGMHILLGGDQDEYLAAWQLQVQSICRITADKR